MGISFWGLAIFTVLFISGYFGWAFYMNSKED
jgi:hypothetical protein